MAQYELIATTTFGIEAVCKRELIALGFKVTATENGKVTFLSDEAGIAKANIWLRSADRVLLKVGQFKAYTWDELFDKTNAFDWGSIIPIDGKFIVNAKSIKSKLFSLTDIQKIVKKSVAKNLQNKYKETWLKETGSEFNILVSILKDVVTITIDTSGVALHKRGYRVESVIAPLKETLAAALVLLSYYSKDRVLYDVFCGSGTIVIEAAMIARNIAPNINRDFAFKHWPYIVPEKVWKEVTREAYKAIDHDSEIKIFASDIDSKNLQSARDNAEAAGVDDCITFARKDYKEIEYKNDYSIVISNPPYGERLSDTTEVESLTKSMGRVFNKLDTWSKYFITSFTEFEKYYRQPADRQRKLYNGRIETRYYQYYGPRPPLK